MYAAYGRLQAIGRDPYELTPAEVFRGQFDPVLRWTERTWQDTPSVYGPITSWLQLLANKLGGENMHDIVFWLQVFSVVPFIVAGGLIILMAHGDRQRPEPVQRLPGGDQQRRQRGGEQQQCQCRPARRGQQLRDRQAGQRARRGQPGERRLAAGGRPPRHDAPREDRRLLRHGVRAVPGRSAGRLTA